MSFHKVSDGERIGFATIRLITCKSCVPYFNFFFISNVGIWIEYLVASSQQKVSDCSSSIRADEDTGEESIPPLPVVHAVGVIQEQR